jgi:hypothetical protein
MTRGVPLFLLSLLGLPLALACGDGAGPADGVQPSFRVSGRTSFALNGDARGFGNGAVRLTGGGSYDPATASDVVPTETSVAASGGFDCTETVSQGLLLGCQTGQGVRWDTEQLLASTVFRCTAAETPRPAATSGRTAVLLADFYRAGDGNEESFQAPMIVSEDDLDSEIDGVQTLWVQGVGCGTAIQHFNAPAE